MKTSCRAKLENASSGLPPVGKDAKSWQTITADKNSIIYLSSPSVVYMHLASSQPI